MPHFQDGTDDEEKLRAVAVRPDNSILLAGWTDGTWTISGDIDDRDDYAAVVLEASVLSTEDTQIPFLSVSPAPTSLTPSGTPQPNYVGQDSGTTSSSNTIIFIGCFTGAAALLVILIVFVTKACRRSRGNLGSGKTNSSSARPRQPHTFVSRVVGAVPRPLPYPVANVVAAGHSVPVLPPVDGQIPPPPPYSQAVVPRP